LILESEPAFARFLEEMRAFLEPNAGAREPRAALGPQ